MKTDSRKATAIDLELQNNIKEEEKLKNLFNLVEKYDIELKKVNFT